MGAGTLFFPGDGMSEGNGGAPKVVGSFTIVVDEQGRVGRRLEGQMPIHVLLTQLEVMKAVLVSQMLVQEQQAQAGQKRVFLPDGSLPPPGMI